MEFLPSKYKIILLLFVSRITRTLQVTLAFRFPAEGCRPRGWPWTRVCVCVCECVCVRVRHSPGTRTHHAPHTTRSQSLDVSSVEGASYQHGGTRGGLSSPEMRRAPLGAVGCVRVSLLLCVDEGTEEQEEGRTGCPRPKELEASVAVHGLILLGSPGLRHCLDHTRTIFLEPLLSTSLPWSKATKNSCSRPVSLASACSLHVRKFRAVCCVTLSPHARETTGSLGRCATSVRRPSRSQLQ